LFRCATFLKEKISPLATLGRNDGKQDARNNHFFLMGVITIKNGDGGKFLRTYIGQCFVAVSGFALNFEKTFAWYLLSSIF